MSVSSVLAALPVAVILIVLGVIGTRRELAAVRRRGAGSDVDQP